MEVTSEFETDAEAVICGELFDVKVISGPNIHDLVTVDVPFENGCFVERVAVTKENVFPYTDKAVEILTYKSYQ